MFTRHLGNGVGHQCQHTPCDQVANDNDNEADIGHVDDPSDGESSRAEEDEDSDGSLSGVENIEKGNSEDGDEFSDEDDTGYDDL